MSTQRQYSVRTTYHKREECREVDVGELVPEKPEYTDAKGKRVKEYGEMGPRWQEGRAG